MNTSKSGRRPQQGLIVVAYCRDEIDWQSIVRSLECDGLEFVTHMDNSTTIAMISSLGESYSKSRLNSIEEQLWRAGFEKVEIQRCVETNIHLRGKAQKLAEEAKVE